MLRLIVSPKRLLYIFGISIIFFLSFDLPILSIDDNKEDVVVETDNFGKRKKSYKGEATYYHNKYHGRKTASGERYNKRKYTAAVRPNKIKVPFGTMLEVTNLENNKTVRVKVNDRMSKRASAIIDVSRQAAKDLGMIKAGRVKVKIKVVSK